MKELTARERERERESGCKIGMRDKMGAAANLSDDLLEREAQEGGFEAKRNNRKGKTMSLIVALYRSIRTPFFSRYTIYKIIRVLLFSF